MTKAALTNNFINICSMTFKTFDFDVSVSQNKSTLWHFIASSTREKSKHYAVMCAPDMESSNSLIKVALSKISNQRLVVVTNSYTDEDLEKARVQDYCLVSIVELKKYGDEMLKIREHESEINVSKAQ